MRTRWTNKRLAADLPRNERYCALLTAGGFQGSVTGPTTWWLGTPPWPLPPSNNGLPWPVWIAHFLCWPCKDREESLLRHENGTDCAAFRHRWQAKRWLEAMADEAARIRAAGCL